jgi:hypothetical protein
MCIHIAPLRYPLFQANMIVFFLKQSKYDCLIVDGNQFLEKGTKKDIC